MSKVVLFSQFVAIHINHDTWKIPKIQDGQVWRNIRSSHLVEKSRTGNRQSSAMVLGRQFYQSS